MFPNSDVQTLTSLADVNLTTTKWDFMHHAHRAIHILRSVFLPTSGGPSVVEKYVDIGQPTHVAQKKLHHILKVVRYLMNIRYHHRAACFSLCPSTCALQLTD